MSKVKNYLITKNYNITDSFFLEYTFKDGAVSPEVSHKLRTKYIHMQNLLQESAMTYLKNLDSIIVDVGDAFSDQIMFYDHMMRLYERYTSEPCNILYCDTDVVFYKETDIFGKYDQFTMAGGNCGVRYYPYGAMDDTVWSIMFDKVKEWDTTLTYGDEKYNWQYEQEIYNLMRDYYGIVHPFTKHLQNVYNPYRDEASIFHYNGSGSSLCDMDIMGECPTLKRARRVYELSLEKRYDLIEHLLHTPPWDRQHPEDPVPDWSMRYPL